MVRPRDPGPDRANINRRARPSRSVMSSSKDSGPPLMPSATASRVTDP